MTPELAAREAEWKQKAANGTLTIEDMIEAIKFLSGNRVSAGIASSTSRARKTAAAKPPERADDLIDDLFGGE